MLNNITLVMIFDLVWGLNRNWNLSRCLDHCGLSASARLCKKRMRSFLFKTMIMLTWVSDGFKNDLPNLQVCCYQKPIKGIFPAKIFKRDLKNEDLWLHVKIWALGGVREHVDYLLSVHALSMVSLSLNDSRIDLSWCYLCYLTQPAHHSQWFDQHWQFFFHERGHRLPTIGSCKC